MSEHYYTRDPQSAHSERTIDVRVCDLALRFTTDAGVFSKAELDRGTRLLLETVGPVRGRALDLGCGWGPVGVVLKRLNPGVEVVMSDVNARALELARRNLALNRVSAEVIESDGFDKIEGLFDHILANPPIRAGKQVIYGLFDTAKERLKPGGALTIVIRKQQGAPSAMKHLQALFGNAEILDKDDGYWIIQSIREESV